MSGTTVDKATVLSLAKRAADSYLSDSDYNSVGEAVAALIGDIPYNMEQVSRIAQATNQRLWDKLSSEKDPAEVRFEPADPIKVMASLGRDYSGGSMSTIDSEKTASTREKTASAAVLINDMPTLLELQERALTGGQAKDAAAVGSNYKSLSRLWASRKSRRAGSVAPHARPPKSPEIKKMSEYTMRADKLASLLDRAVDQTEHLLHQKENEFRQTLWSMGKVANDMRLTGASHLAIKEAVSSVVPEDTAAALLQYLDERNKLSSDRTKAAAFFDELSQLESIQTPLTDRIRAGRLDKTASEVPEEQELNPDHPLVKAAQRAQSIREEALDLAAALERLQKSAAQATVLARVPNAKV